MNKIVFVALMVSLMSCQELILDDYTVGQEVDKIFTRANWNNEREIAIYGWIKISSSYDRSRNWSTVFQFTSNTDNMAGEWASPGDRVLAFFAMNNVIITPTYSLAQNNNNVYANYNIKQSEIDQWAFFYLAHGPNTSQHQVFIKFPYYTIMDTISNITHKPSTYYKIMIGKSYNQSFWFGNIFKVFIQVGAGAFRTSGFDALQQYNSPSNPNPAPVANGLPNPLPSCVTLYPQCNYGGTPISACGNIPSFNINSIKSIYVPAGKTYTIYGSANYSGKKAVFSQSQSCITSFNWQFLYVSKRHSIQTKPLEKKNKHQKVIRA